MEFAVCMDALLVDAGARVVFFIDQILVTK